jgi:hypothetical protein
LEEGKVVGPPAHHVDLRGHGLELVQAVAARLQPDHAERQGIAAVQLELGSIVRKYFDRNLQIKLGKKWQNYMFHCRLGAIKGHYSKINFY